MSAPTTIEETRITNGVNVTAYENTVDAVKADPGLAQFQFRARNRWDTGASSQTTIKGFYAAGQEHGTDGRAFVLEADQPPVLLGEDKGPNPVELLLHSLASCFCRSTWPTCRSYFCPCSTSVFTPMNTSFSCILGI